MRHLMRQPLLRLLAVNGAAGFAAAVLMLGGLLTLNPGNLRALIFADQAAGAAFGLLLFGLTVTFASAAMGSAVMGLGREHTDKSGGASRDSVRVRVRS